ncbi:MAG: hypothetical protein M3Z32_08425 [Acidobacteriota bacterium]|nr:hypothetical protein [Acidobacteriota bacterium]
MSQTFNVAESIVVLILTVIVCRLWTAHRLDVYRQEMFRLRDELFDYAKDGRISFSHPAYRLLRRSMNGFIRYGHQLTFFQLCMNLLRWNATGDKPPLDWANSWTTAVNSIQSEQVKRDLQSLHGAALMLVVKRLISESPSLVLAVSFVTAYIALHQGIRNIKSVVKSASSRVLERIVDPRIIEEDAVRLSV